MSDFIFEKAGIEDLDTLVKLRTAYILEDNWAVPREKLSIISEKLPDYFREHLNGDCFAYTAKYGGETVSCCILVVSEKPPNLGFMNGIVGTVMNVYTKPEYRRKGLAGKLMKTLLADAEKMELDFVELKATEEGYGLYKSLGFEDTVSKYHNMKIAFNRGV
ncbi:MAG: GNAT family N-acetyltransferase [Prevotella sp.]|nr:GNAT family N-acetyltransferase [Prevotella sp.]